MRALICLICCLLLFSHTNAQNWQFELASEWTNPIAQSSLVRVDPVKVWGSGLSFDLGIKLGETQGKVFSHAKVSVGIYPLKEEEFKKAYDYDPNNFLASFESGTLNSTAFMLGHSIDIAALNNFKFGAAYHGGWMWMQSPRIKIIDVGLSPDPINLDKISVHGPAFSTLVYLRYPLEKVSLDLRLSTRGAIFINQLIFDDFESTEGFDPFLGAFFAWNLGLGISYNL